ncbi:MAG: hypothetical protein LBL47_02875 [Lactobacillus sp.]|jgi:lipopolysaccharide biosynthesis protein|nr:hypothetical protein [Lactobacillus sp.]
MKSLQNMKKRACLIGGFDKQGLIDNKGIIHDYVVYFVEKLSEFCDVYFYTDNPICEEELAKVRPFTKYAAGHRYGRYDFGSWSLLIKEIGYDKLEQYDELILTNDSCFGPMFPFKEMFDKMDAQNLDAWSICGNKFLMSFFVVLNKKVFMHDDFKYFFDNIKEEEDKYVVIKKYEHGLNSLITENGFSTGLYISNQDVKSFYKKNKKDIHKKIKEVVPFWPRLFIRFSPNKIRLYEEDFVLPFFMHMPLLKKISLHVTTSVLPVYYRDLIKDNCDYPIELIDSFLEKSNSAPPAKPWPRIKEKIKDKLKRFMHDKKYRGDKIITRVFTIPIKSKKMDYKI